MQALNVCSAFKSLSYLFPVLAVILLYSLCQLLVFVLGPVAFDFAICLSVLSLLVLGWPPLIQIRIHHLMSNQILLSFTILEVINVLRELAHAA